MSADDRDGPGGQDGSSPGRAFTRRTLSFGALLLSLGRLLWRGPRLLALHLSSRRLRPPLREAIWLAVTEVNGCRFCAYIHEGMAGVSGLSRADVDLLLASSDPASLAGLSAPEAEAVAYAKLWAESSGRPPAGTGDGVAAAFGPRGFADLHALLTLVDFANRSGNTLDSLLHRFAHPARLLAPWGALNDLLVGLLVALFGWPALVAGALARFRARRRHAGETGPR